MIQEGHRRSLLQYHHVQQGAMSSIEGKKNRNYMFGYRKNYHNNNHLLEPFLFLAGLEPDPFAAGEPAAVAADVPFSRSTRGLV